jgi:hypothetical protein
LWIAGHRRALPVGRPPFFEGTAQLSGHDAH